MRRSTEISLIERALERIAQRRSDMSDAPSVLEPRRYTSPEHLAAERATLFRRYPLLAGWSSQIPAPGDTLTTDLAGLGVMIVRQADGGLAAFVNACRHRGVPLVGAPCVLGRRAFTCRFHGWTYDLEGQLRGVPDADGFLPRGDTDLRRLPVAEKAGMIFVIPTPGATLDLDAWLGPIGDELESWGLGALQMVRPSVRERAHNWKMYMDATLECYHIPFLHSATGGAGWMSRVGLFDHLRPHARSVLPDPTLPELEEADPATWSLRDHAALVYTIFPNTIVVLHMGSVNSITVLPGSAPGRCVLRGASLMPASGETDEAAQRRHAYNLTYWKTMDEDFDVMEAMQLNLEGGAIERLLVGRQEHLLADYHAALDAAMAGGLPI